MNEGKIKRLKRELRKYQKRLKQMQKRWSATKSGSRYGDEYLETQIKVYERMIGEVEGEIFKLRKYLEIGRGL